MDREQLRDYCLSKKAALEDFPFGQEVAVMKVMGKMFALLPVEGKVQISLKCDPIFSQLLRDTYPAVTPGWHLNKKHWNDVKIDGSIAEDEILEMIDHSYEQVVKGLTKAQRSALAKQL
ncbi:MAG: MmcQ/YjbR family DNA-binding protein [Chloroflexota bacterium]